MQQEHPPIHLPTPPHSPQQPSTTGPPTHGTSNPPTLALQGLNLNIRRVVFTSLSKFDGLEERPLTAAETKQIAGRAGRWVQQTGGVGLGWGGVRRAGAAGGGGVK